MKCNIIKLIAAFTMGVMLLTGCGKENDGIVGDWQWTGTSVHYVDNYTGQESTENMDFPAEFAEEFLAVIFHRVH